MTIRMLDIDEALAYLRERGAATTKKSLYSQLSRTKKPRAKKIGRRLRFKEIDLDEHVESITKDR
jgi:hypothetical protein